MPNLLVGSWLLVVGGWLLVVGWWLFVGWWLVVVCWLVGGCLLVGGWWLLTMPNAHSPHQQVRLLRSDHRLKIAVDAESETINWICSL